MRESILILIVCVIVNKVTAPAPFKSPSTSLPYPKSTTPPAPRPKWSDYSSKKSAAKPMKDNAYLASLVKKPPKDSQKQVETIKEANKTIMEETECLNATKVLFAEEIASHLIRLSEKESKEVKTTEKEIKKTEIDDLTDPKMNVTATEPKKAMKLHELFKPLSIKPKVNNTENQNRTFVIPPTMIPIFRPNPNLARSQISKEELAIITSVPKAAAVTQDFPASVGAVVQDLPASVGAVVQDLPASVEKAELPPNEAKPNLNSNANAIPFNIPCHKASDVLDEIPDKPEILRQSHAKLNFIPKAVNPVLQEPNQVEKPEKLETDESVAIIFKPKNISLLNVYGDLLKKITLTVLVPYHISKLGT